MNAGSAEPDRRPEQGARPAPPKSGKTAPHSLAETMTFGVDSVARQTHAGTPRPPKGDGTGAEGSSKPGGTPKTSHVEPPEVVGRFRVEKLLGRGGMASVYLARDVQLDRPVALKIPRLTDNPDGTVIPRFFREARTAATLNHPNICPIYDVGQDGDTYFIAMGFIQGRALTDYISSGKRQPDRQVAIVVRKVALALEHAHARGILHRDLKPANIMIDQRGEPIVMDFGLACRLDDKWETRLTQDGAVIGTPTYMSPEQIDSRCKVGPASDVYSLGVVIYELLTGECPFTGSLVSVIGQVLHAEAKPVAELRPDVPPALAEICERAMCKNPQNRFASMKELAQALGGFLKGEASGAAALQSLQAAGPVPGLEGLEALLEETSPAAGDANLGIQLSPLRKAASPAWSRSAVWGLAGGAAAVVIGAVCVIATISRSSNPPESVAAGVDGAASAAHVAATQPPGTRAEADSTSSPPSPTPSIAADAPSTMAKNAAGEATQSAPQTSPGKDEVASVEGQDEAQPLGDVAAPAAVPPAKDASPDDVPPGAATTPGDGAGSVSVVHAGPAANGTSPPSSENPADKEPAAPKPAAPKPASIDDRHRERPEPPRGPGGGRPEPPFPRNDGMDRPGGPPFTPPEIKSVDALEKYFHEADRNGDGRLDPSELPMHIILRVTKGKADAISFDDLKRAYAKLGSKIFAAPTAAEKRKLPTGPPPGEPRREPPPGGRPPR